MNSIKLFALLVVASVASASHLVGVDPNTLSCDPAGQIFLLLPHYTECNKYYVCDHGLEKERECPSVTIFDFEAQTCNWDWATKCWLRSEDDIEGSGDEPDVTDSYTDSADDVMNDFDRPADVDIAHGVLDAILNCRTLQSASQQVAYRGDCQRYWRCESSVPQAVYCSDGLFFNPASRQCDYEANVKCHVLQDDELQGEFLEYK